MRVVVVGGCGHVGLPLAVVLADHGHQVVSFDIDSDVVKRVNAAEAPFMEPGLDDLLTRTRTSGAFVATDDPASIAAADIVIVVIGTPVDDHLNPDPSTVVNALAQCAPHMSDDQLIVLRSTIYPGVTSRVEQMLRDRGLSAQVVFCPERIAEGFAVKELTSLPQIVGGRDPAAIARAEELFSSIGISTVVVTPEEAELAKLFTNTWRYIKFAAANQFWLMANEAGVDYTRVRHAITFEYPRAADVPGAGFAAGPCLFKDTMQLAAFTNNNFVLGHSAMLVNEGLPLYVVDRISQRFDIGDMTVGILGMAFKSESDDTRSSLSYKLKRILRFRAREVLTTDPYVTSDSTLLPLEDVVSRADLLIIGAPHRAYAELAGDIPVIDIWNLRGEGSLI